jgi:hypothetical protein
MENKIREAAQQKIYALLRESYSDSGAQANVQAKLSIAQSALMYPTASIGNCAMDGSDLHFEGRKNGLYICCAGDPKTNQVHCWMV